MASWKHCGWFFGFKLRLPFNGRSELLNLALTPGNVDDRQPVPRLGQRLVGKVFADQGYISRSLFQQLLETFGLQLITRLKSNMKNRLLPLVDKPLLHKRFNRLLSSAQEASMKQTIVLFIVLLLVACTSLPLPAAVPTSSGAETQVSTASATLPVSPKPVTTIWRPAVGATWQWQLLDLPIDQSFDVAAYDIELFDNEASIVAALHAEGRRVICYISVGSWEDWRPDRDQFPPDLIGNDYGGWAGEKWLDIRQIDRLAPVLRARLDQCQAKGFDAVEPDNIDGYTNDTGFPLTEADQLQFNIWLAEEAHQRGLSIGLKNDPDQAAALEPYFDWALTEDCFAEGWCEQVLPFIEAGKAVFAAEYTDTGITLDEICSQASKLKFSVILKNRELDAYRAACS